MRRRDFIAGIACSAPASVWPLTARAQQALPVIGFLNGGSPAGFAHLVAAFKEGLSEAGYVDGRNVAIEFRWAQGENHRLPGLATDLVRREIIPGGVFIIHDGKVLACHFRGLNHVLIEVIDGPQISQVPVETGAVQLGSRGNAGHHNIAAIAGVARHDKAPGLSGLRPGGLPGDASGSRS